MLQKEHERENSNLKRMIDASHDFTALYDGALNAVYINSAGKQFGDMKSQEDGASLSLLKLLPKSDLFLFQSEIVPGLLEKGWWRGEHTIQTSKGLKISVFAEYICLEKKSEGFDLFSVMLRDISAQKKIESELLVHRENLEELVQARTREFEAVNQELESFSYSVSHDLRAPLRAIDGFSKILKGELTGAGHDGARNWLERIEKNSRRMSLLIDDLLKLSRVMGGELTIKQVDISAAIHAVVTRLRSVEPERQVVLQVEEGLSGRADYSLIEVLLANLLENAWKYSSREQVAKIECRSVIRGVERYICIKDNGVGLNMKYADKLFTPFQRLHTQEEFPGTGIGLATVKRILNRHGGDIFVESIEGEGASFYFRFAQSSHLETGFFELESDTA